MEELEHLEATRPLESFVSAAIRVSGARTVVLLECRQPTQDWRILADTGVSPDKLSEVQGCFRSWLEHQGLVNRAGSVTEPASAALLAALDAQRGLLAVRPVLGGVVAVLLGDHSSAFGESDSESLTLLAESLYESSGLSVADDRLRQLSHTLVELNKSSDLESFLGELIRCTRSLLFAEAAYVGLVTESSELNIMASEGLMTEEMRTLSLGYGDGIGGKAVAELEPVMVADYLKDPRLVGRLRTIATAEQIVACVGVPMRSNQQRVGVLYAAYRYPHKFSSTDMYVITTLAAFAGPAIYAYRQRQALETRMAVSQAASQMQLDLHGTVLYGGGLHDLATQLAETLGCGVVIGDETAATTVRSEASYPPGIDPVALETLLFRLAGEHAGHVRTQVAAAPGYSLHVALVPVSGREGLLGFIAALSPDRAPDDYQLQLLKSALPACAHEFVRRQTTLLTTRQLQEDFVSGLVDGHHWSPEEVERRAHHLGFHVGAPYRMVLVGPDPAGGDRSPQWNTQWVSAMRRALHNCVSRVLVQSGAPVISFRPDLAVLFIPAAMLPHDQSQEKAWIHFADYLQRQVQSQLRDVTLSIAISRETLSLMKARPAFEEALLALRTAWSMGGRGRIVVNRSSLLNQMLFAVADKRELAAATEAILGPLLAYDRAHNTEFEPTLRTYLGQDGAAEGSARVLFIHVNTLRYRLQRISQILTCDVTEPAVRFDLNLAYQIRDFVRMLTGSGST